MSRARDKIDIESYLKSRIAIRNVEGGRGYDHGVRTFDCPWCGDERGRGWLNVDYWTAGCFNAGCDAEPRIDGGALEWVRAVENFKTYGKTLAFLQAKHPSLVARTKPKPVAEYTDWCRLPPDMRHFNSDVSMTSPWQRTFIEFAMTQWRLTVADLIKAPAGWCVNGRHAWRLIFPILMDGRLVAFQTRMVRSSAEWAGSDRFAKYLMSRHGPRDDPGNECGRPADAILYGLDQVKEHDEIVIVEGIADVLALRRKKVPAVALLGTQLSSEKIALLRKKKPGRVVVALDSDGSTTDAASETFRSLLAWGFETVVAKWSGGKDAGSGGELNVERSGLASEILGRLS